MLHLTRHLGFNAQRNIGPTAWDPAHKGSRLTLSNGNLTGTFGAGSPNGNHTVRATVGKSSGKWYFECLHSTYNVAWGPVSSGFVGDLYTPFEVNDMAANDAIGVYSRSSPAQSQLRINNAAAFFLANYSPVTAGVWLSWAIDLDAKLVWVSIGGGSWNDDGSANPVTGVGGASFSSLSDTTWYPGASLDTNGTTFTANFGATAYQRARPTGFLDWA